MKMENKELFDIKTKCILIKEYGSDYYNTCVQNKEKLIKELNEYPIKKSCKSDFEHCVKKIYKRYDERIIKGENKNISLRVPFLKYYVDKRKLKKRT